MTCQNIFFSGAICDRPARLKVWCPTWTQAAQGPMNVCSNCARRFQPKHNPNTIKGNFFWNQEADEAFARIGDSQATKFK